MKLVIIEPLGVEREKLMQMAQEVLPDTLEIEYFDTRAADTETLIARGREADIIAVSNLPLNKEVIEGCPKLKLIAVAFTGVDHIAMECCRERGILVCNCAGYSNAAVSDLVFGMLISLYRNIIPCNERIRNGGTKEGLVGLELEGKKFGVVGFGAIGSRVASIAKAFGCEVYAYNHTPRAMEDVKFVSLEELMEKCDIISLHVPLTKETRGLIDAEKISLMKPTAVLINTARGPVVDSSALAEALNREAIAGACVDVFETEPPIDSSHVLLQAKNVIATPHTAFATKEAMVKRAGILFHNIRAYMAGQPENLV